MALNQGQQYTGPDTEASGVQEPAFAVPPRTTSRPLVSTPAPEAEKAASPSQRPSARASIRPSAFGPPQRPSQLPPASPARASIPPAPPAGASLSSSARDASDAGSSAEPFVEIALPPPTHDESLPSEDVTPTPSGSRLRVQPQIMLPPAEPANDEPPSVRRNLEEIMPLVAVSSIPPSLTLPEPVPPKPQDPRRNRLSFAIFGIMLAASAIPLVRYVTSSDAVSPAAPVLEAPKPASQSQALPAPRPALSPNDKPEADPLLEELAAIEAGLPDDPVVAADQLIARGLRALSQGDDRLSEALLGRALKRDDDNPRAYYALARIRMRQGNLEGAEGWILSAIYKRPRRPEYHALYAQVLDGLNRPEEAARARARAAELKASSSSKSAD